MLLINKNKPLLALIIWSKTRLFKKKKINSNFHSNNNKK